MQGSVFHAAQFVGVAQFGGGLVFHLHLQLDVADRVGQLGPVLRVANLVADLAAIMARPIADFGV